MSTPDDDRKQEFAEYLTTRSTTTTTPDIDADEPPARRAPRPDPSQGSGYRGAVHVDDRADHWIRFLTNAAFGNRNGHL